MCHSKFAACCLVMIIVTGCQHPVKKSEFQFENVDFERGLTEQKLPVGWQAHINDGYLLTVDRGFRGDSHALKMDGGDGGKAVMLYQKVTLEQPLDARFVLSGYLATANLKGEAALYFRAFADGQLIHQDDMRAYALFGNQPWSEVVIRSPLLQAVTVVEFGVLSMGEGTAWVDDLTLIQLQGEAISQTVKLYADEAFESIKSNSIYPIDPATKDRFYASLKGAQVIDDVHGSLVHLLHEMGDDHASFLPAFVVENSPDKSTGDAKELKTAGNVPSSPQRLAELGHIKIPGFKKGTDDVEAYIDAATDAFIQGLTEARCGWVVDLRGNTGGSMWPMLAAVAPLLDAEVVGYMLDSQGGVLPWRVTHQGVLLAEEVKQPFGDDQMALRQKLLADNRNQQIAVLMDANTASSAEAVAMAFKGQDGVTFFGDKSSGFTTGISQVELSDGSLVRLSIAHFADRNQQVYSTGLEPDLAVDGALPLIDQVHQFLTGQESCQQ